MSSLTAILRPLVPPVLVDLIRRWRGRRLRFNGLPRDWQAACAMSVGYADGDIVDRVATATRAVVEGRAAFERDSVLFAEQDFRFPVVAALMHVAALRQGRLEVIDFGGALGSTYWQCRPFLHGLQHVRWQVVEQPTFVAVGRREFTTDQLSFSESIASQPASPQPQLVLACGVLEYLENPLQQLDEFAKVNASHLLIDRTPVHEGPEHHLCIQRVPAEIYRASYPCWIFSRSQFMNHLLKEWRVVSEFACDEGGCETDEGLRFEFRGIYLERRQ